MGPSKLRSTASPGLLAPLALAFRQFGSGRLVLLILVTALLRAVSFSQTPLLFENADLDLDGLFLHRRERPFFASPFSEWENLRHLKLKAVTEWTPTLHATGSAPATLRGYQESQTLYFAFGSQAIVKFGLRRILSETSLKDSARYALDLRSARQGLPFGFLYHLVPPTESGTLLDLLLDFHAVEKLDYTLGFNWLMASAPGGPVRSRLQFLQTRRDGSEIIHFQDLRPAGSGENVQAVFNSRLQSTSALMETALGPGLVAGSFKYSWSTPILPLGEYGFTDSSRTLRLGASFRAPSTWGSIWYAYEEGSLRTTGLRIPPGSGGSKRFHYALIGNSLQELRLESPGWALFRTGTSSMELGTNWLTTSSAPSVDAFGQNKETLSYNRLGLSYIADIYGGFSRNGELIHADGTFRQIVWTAKHRQGFSGPRLGKLELDFSLPLAITWIDLELAGETVDKGVFSTTLDRTYAYGRRGRILSVTPRLASDLTLSTWGKGTLSLGGKVSQVLLVWKDLEDTHRSQSNPGSGGSGENTATAKSDYSAGTNGFLGEVSLAFDF